jgi:hypothetical protein
MSPNCSSALATLIELFLILKEVFPFLSMTTSPNASKVAPANRSLGMRIK